MPPPQKKETTENGIIRILSQFPAYDFSKSVFF